MRYDFARFLHGFCAILHGFCCCAGGDELCLVRWCVCALMCLCGDVLIHFYFDMLFRIVFRYDDALICGDAGMR